MPPKLLTSRHDSYFRLRQRLLFERYHIKSSITNNITDKEESFQKYPSVANYPKIMNQPKSSSKHEYQTDGTIL